MCPFCLAPQIPGFAVSFSFLHSSFTLLSITLSKKARIHACLKHHGYHLHKTECWGICKCWVITRKWIIINCHTALREEIPSPGARGSAVYFLRNEAVCRKQSTVSWRFFFRYLPCVCRRVQTVLFAFCHFMVTLPWAHSVKIN